MIHLFFLKKKFTFLNILVLLIETLVTVFRIADSTEPVNIEQGLADEVTRLPIATATSKVKSANLVIGGGKEIRVCILYFSLVFIK